MMVCGANNGDVIMKAHVVLSFAPFRIKPSAMGMVAQAHPGRMAPKRLPKIMDSRPFPSHE